MIDGDFVEGVGKDGGAECVGCLQRCWAADEAFGVGFVEKVEIMIVGVMILVGVEVIPRVDVWKDGAAASAAISGNVAMSNNARSWSS